MNLRKATATILIVSLLVIAQPIDTVRCEFGDDQEPIFNADIWLIQVDKSEMDSIEKELGFHLNPPDGKVFLSKEERSKLLKAFENAKSAKILRADSLRTFQGCCNARWQDEEVKFPYKYKHAISDQ